MERNSYELQIVENQLIISFRFILSLASCKTCMAIDDQLNILPISSHTLNIKGVPPKPMVSNACVLLMLFRIYPDTFSTVIYFFFSNHDPSRKI